MTVTPELLLAFAAAVFAGYVVFGATGFGAAPITIPVLAHFLPLPAVLGITTLLDFGSGVALGFHTRREAERRELALLIPFTLAGVALGVTLLVNLPRTATLGALGVFVCAYAVYGMLRPAPARPLTRRWAAPAGLASGVFGALFGVGGPPYAVYLAARIREAARLRATISSMLVASVGIRLVAFLIAGVLADARLWLTAVALAPMAALGLWTGNRLHRRAPASAIRRTVLLVLLGMGVSLLVRAFAQGAPA